MHPGPFALIQVPIGNEPVIALDKHLEVDDILVAVRVGARLHPIQSVLRPPTRSKASSRGGSSPHTFPNPIHSVLRRFVRQSEIPPAPGHQPHQRATSIIDVARFLIGSVITLPFAGWVSLYVHGYLHRVDNCLSVLTKAEPSFDSSRLGIEKRCKLYGREEELEFVQRCTDGLPHEVLVIAGTNEVGKR